MKLTRTLVALSAFGVIASSQAQISIPMPFPGLIGENFNTITLGSYTNFIGFGGVGGFQAIGTGGLLHVNNNTFILPPITGNDMYGRGIDVRIKYAQTWKRWGGRFRAANAGFVVNMMTVEFYKASVLVGSSVTAPVNNTNWLWRGWNLAPLGGFDEVRIYGNGALPGYIGMENLRCH